MNRHLAALALAVGLGAGMAHSQAVPVPVLSRQDVVATLIKLGFVDGAYLSLNGRVYQLRGVSVSERAGEFSINFRVQ